jgi:hypothetical protein
VNKFDYLLLLCMASATKRKSTDTGRKDNKRKPDKRKDDTSDSSSEE